MLLITHKLTNNIKRLFQTFLFNKHIIWHTKPSSDSHLFPSKPKLSFINTNSFINPNSFTMDHHGCDMGLNLKLGLGFVDSFSLKRNNNDSTKPFFELPLLSLSLVPDGQLDQGTVKVVKRHDRENSGQSTVSSFSNSGLSVKRERSDEEEDYNCFSNNDGVRKKLRLKKEQAQVLEERFKQQSTLNPKQKQALARQLNLSPRQVEVWYQNRRARTKLKQTELDYEYLKKCCETLTEENRRLVKELKELKALKQAQPNGIKLPAATLSFCPSCEGVTTIPARGGDSSSKPKFFNTSAY